MTTKEEDRTIIQLDSNSASWSDDDDSSRVSSDEEDRFQDEDDGSWKSITPTHDEDAEEFGFLQSPTNNNNVEPPLKRRMESMGIMLGDFGGDTDSNKEHWCSRYWYVWLCVSVLLVTLFLAYDAAKQYQKQADLLRGTANGLDDFDISQCNVFDGATLNIVEKVFNEVNDTSKFCQTDKLEKCQCKHPFDAHIPQAHQAQWRAAAKLNQALIKEHLKPRPDVVLLGDSIVEHLAGRNLGYSTRDWAPLKNVFDNLFTKAEGGKVNGIPLGIGGDRIPNLLYRLQNGEASLDFHPKVWWIASIGTNDLEDFCNADTIVVGIFHLVDEIRKYHPGSKIVLNSILPRNDSPDLESSPTWEIIKEINLKLECYSNTAFNVDFFDATGVFTYTSNGKKVVNSKFMKDPVHPNAEGSRLWSEAIVDRVVELKDKVHHGSNPKKKKKKGHHHLNHV